MTGSKLSIFSHPGKIIGFLDYCKIISMVRANMGLDFVSGKYECFFSRCRKYVINSLIHGHFHIALVIIPRPILGGFGMITRPLWKCPYINMYILLSLGRYFGRLLVPQGIFCSVVSVSALTWFIKYIYHCDVPVRKSILKWWSN